MSREQLRLIEEQCSEKQLEMRVEEVEVPWCEKVVWMMGSS
jgi:hypothetical protein